MFNNFVRINPKKTVRSVSISRPIIGSKSTTNFLRLIGGSTFNTFSFTSSIYSEPKLSCSENLEKLPSSSKVVICGGGVLGASVAYHLAELGWGPDTIVVEQGRLGGGVTYHSSGLVAVFKPSRPQVKLCQESVKLYKELTAQGHNLGWKQCGTLNVARTRDRMTYFRRMKAQAIAFGIECELVSPEEAQKLCPIIQVDDLKGGIWIPGDGVCNPYDICISLLDIAKKKGVQVYEFCGVERVITDGDRVTGVQTNQGTVQCQAFVNSGGFWARHIGQMSNPPVKVPLHPVEHYYLHTKPIEGLDPMTPVVRDLDGQVYLRELKGSLLAGGFEPVAKPAYEDGSIPFDMIFRTLQYIPVRHLVLDGVGKIFILKLGLCQCTN